MKRTPILPLGTPDRPRSPARIEPAEIRLTFRARFWRIASIALALLWGAVVGVLIGGGLPW